MISGLVTLIIWLLVIGVLWWLVNYIADTVPLPQPINKLVKVVATVVAVLVILVVLLQLVGVSVGGLNMPKLE